MQCSTRVTSVVHHFTLTYCACSVLLYTVQQTDQSSAWLPGFSAGVASTSSSNNVVGGVAAVTGMHGVLPSIGLQSPLNSLYAIDSMHTQQQQQQQRCVCRHF
jgi:hypothetical protein